MAQSSSPALSLQPLRGASLTSQLLRPTASPSSAQQLHIETMQMLKERLTGNNQSSSGSNSGAASAASSSASASAPSASAASLPPSFTSMTWSAFLTLLPPSANAAGHPEVVALKAAFNSFLASVATLVDDERSSAALAETAAGVYRIAANLSAKEEAATAAAQALASRTLSGSDAHSAAAPSAELLTQLKALAAAARSAMEKEIGRFVEGHWKKCLALAKDLRVRAAEMHRKYDQARLVRELNRLPSAAAAAAPPGKDKDDSSGGHFLPAPRDDTGMEPLLSEEFGADLPIMLADADEAAEADEEENDAVLASSALSCKPVRDVLEQLRKSLKNMGLSSSSSSAASAAPSSAATAAPGSILGLTPGAGSSAAALDDLSDFESDDDLDAGESEEDEDERLAAQLAGLQKQQVRTMHETRPSPYSLASLPAGSVPTNPAQWWSYLTTSCEKFVTYSDTGIPLVSAAEIAQQALSILQSSKSDVQADLLDLLGFEHMEMLELLIAYRKEIKSITSQHQAQARQSKAERESVAESQTRKAADGSVIRGLVGISIQTSTDIEMNKNRKRADRRHARRSARETGGADAATLGPSRTFIDEAKLDAQASALKPWINSNAAQAVSTLPPGSTRERFKGYEQVFIPPLIPGEIIESDLRQIKESFDEFAQQAFPKMKTLNRIQSKVYESAYHHNNNLLICAPTGAGKTNVAMMCILREIQAHIVDGVLQKDSFKMVYVAPMKALAQEVQATFQKRLGPLGILVKELTGDMQLTKKELAETQLIVTTPEKWDVVTRKNTDGGNGGSGLSGLVRLLILDELHLLNEDRGPVLEILVARTLRLVESSQRMCRIVGLSATLPNYNDVAVFVRAQPGTGLFFFDQSYRPVPLSQTFIGVTEPNQMRRLQSMNDVAYKKCLEAVKAGHQVMIFVHSRRDTVKTAKHVIDAARKDENSAFFDTSAEPEYAAFERKIMRSRNSDLTEMFPSGFGCHHAGMIRPDRSLVEAAFSAGIIKVLVCTATLAWGVNLPAHTVIIKGTQIYNAEKGGFQDVGMLDIMQIFGRAGRPQFDDSGDAILICEHEKLNNYLQLLTHQLPIESQFIKELPNHLNAEIQGGSVTTLNEAVQWLSYTYLYTRMLRNPLVYGISYDEMQFDELLVQRRSKLILEAAKLLMRCRMIKFDLRSGQFYSTDVGRVASHYYLHFESIEMYNELLTPIMTDEDVLHLLASSKEFAAIKTREEEVVEIEKLRKKYQPLTIKGGLESASGKQNLLLQVYISNGIIDTPTLVSDSYFIHQSAGRICRALFEMVLKRGRAHLAIKFLTWAQMIERKIWNFQSPLRQFLVSSNAGGPSSKGGAEGDRQHGGLLKMPTIMRLEERGLKIDQLVDMTASEINAILKHDSLGSTVLQCVGYIPFLAIEASIQPITRSVLRIDIELTPEFSWHDRHHGLMESFWVWIEDANSEHIYHSENFALHKASRSHTHKLIFTIPIQEPLPPQYYIKVVSDRWLGSENVYTLNFKHLILPEMTPNHTALLDLHPLPRSALRNPIYEQLYERKFTHFNAVQTQIFHTLYHTDENILLGAPTGSGKTVVSELSMLRLFSNYPGSKVVYIAPLKALARERIEDWTSSRSFQGVLGKKIVELTGDTAPDQRAIMASDIIITTPEKWDGISRGWQTRPFVKMVGLVIIDEIHLLGADRGPVLEVIVSRMRYISSHTATPIRIVGLSTALSNARDLGDWLGIERAGLFNFPPSVRPVPLTIHVAGFAGKHYCPRMASMNKPTYAAIQTHSPDKPVLVFVSSRRQTRLTGLDLISLSAADGNPRKWLSMSESALQQALKHVVDPNLRNMLSFGVGMHHAGLAAKDRMVVEKLFLEQKIQVLVCTSTLAWGVNFPAHLCIVKGTEFYDAKTRSYVDFPITDVLQMIGRAGRPQFDSEAKAVVLVQESKKAFYINFLNSPFPVESSLLTQLHNHFNAEICSSGTIKSIADSFDYLSWTFFFRRLLLNPSYYGLVSTEKEELNSFLRKLVGGILGDLANAGLILMPPLSADGSQDDGGKIVPLTLGRIASFYYLHWRTMTVFSERLRPDSSIESLLETLAYAKEFEELPVRHNEDRVCAELARDPGILWKVDGTAWDSPHTKAHLLLQSHLSRLDFEVSDYYTDLKSVLDQTIRVLQAIVETTSEAGWVAAARNTMRLMQMIVQGRWESDSTLLNLPGMDPNAAASNPKLRAALEGAGLRSLSALARADRSRVQSLLRKAGANEKQEREFMEALGRMPVVNMSLATSVESAAASASSSSNSSSASKPLSLSSPLSLPAGSASFPLTVTLHRTNSNPSVRIVTPVFSKPKDEGWWLLVGISSLPGHAARESEPTPQDELVAIKRVSNLKKTSVVNLKISVPPQQTQAHYTVHLVSDSYLGLDCQHSFQVTFGAQGAGRNNKAAGGAAASSSSAASAAAAAAAAAADPDDIYN